MIDSIAQLTAALSDRYAIEREIGAGGMATVYLARDLKHERPVALKVLNPELGAVLGVERFLSEIKVTANLQHPNLLPLFDSGEAAGLLFYVMPYVEGESLRVKLDREKQFPVEDAVRISVAVANALDYAHQHGVIHRDLKPENILLQSGQPVIADFGIALAVSKAGGNRITQTGLSLGTPQYMSPEQATGDRVIDGRSDIYSLAAVTYEMLTGEPPHIGNTAQAIIARVLTDRPRPIRASRSAVPEHVEATLERALEKLPADRFGTAHEFADALQGRSPTSISRPAMTAAAKGGGWRARLKDPVVLTLAALAVGAAAMAVVEMRKLPSGGATRAIRYIVSVGDSLQGGNGFPWPAAISPDGGTIVFAATAPAKPPMLYSLNVDQLEPHAIPGTEGGFQPLFSPDGKWVAFEVTGKDKKVRLDGSAPVNISTGGSANGADWTTKNELLLGSQGNTRGLARVSAAGGDPKAFTFPDSAHGERNHLWPIAFPDGRTVALIIWYGDMASARLALTTVDDGKVSATELKAIRPLAVVDGRLLYVQADGAVMAVAVDASKRRVTGQPFPVLDPVHVPEGNNGNSDIFVSSGGALITARGADLGQLGWYEKDRSFHPVVRETRGFQSPRLSPDGKKIAMIISDGQQSDVWIEDLSTATLSRTTSLGAASCVEWTRDGKQLLVSGGGRSEHWLVPATGGAPPRRLAKLPDLSFCATLTPDGNLMVSSVLFENSWDLWTISTDSMVKPKPFVVSPATDWAARFSPDGHWIAYESDQSGQAEVFIRSFPDPSVFVQISAGSGHTPVWSRDGTKVFYVSGDALVRARTSGPPAFQVLARDTVMSGAGDFFYSIGNATFDLSPDGERVLAVRRERRGAQLIAVPNWIVEYRERVAAAEKK